MVWKQPDIFGCSLHIPMSCSAWLLPTGPAGHARSGGTRPASRHVLGRIESGPPLLPARLPVPRRPEGLQSRVVELRLLQDPNADPFEHREEPGRQFLFSLLARKPDRQTDLRQQPSHPPGPRLPVLGLDREQIPHDAGVAQGADDVGIGKCDRRRSCAGIPAGPSNIAERFSSSRNTVRDPSRSAAEPHGPARDRKARLVEILHVRESGEMEADRHDRQTATSRDPLDHGPSEIAIPNMSSMACGPSGLRSGRRRQA